MTERKITRKKGKKDRTRKEKERINKEKQTEKERKKERTKKNRRQIIDSLRPVNHEGHAFRDDTNVIKKQEVKTNSLPAPYQIKTP